MNASIPANDVTIDYFQDYVNLQIYRILKVNNMKITVTIIIFIKVYKKLVLM